MPFSESEIAFVQASEILRDIPPGVVLAMLRANQDDQFNLQPNDVFIEAGQLDPGLFLVANGTIELFAINAEGAEKILDFVKAGETLAKETLFSNRPLLYSARALTQAAVLRLPNDLILQWSTNYPTFARRLMSLVAERINFLYKDMFTFRAKRATARLVCYLVCRFDKAPKTSDGSYSLHIDIPRHKLASRLGISDSQISRSFGELQEKGLIIPRGRGYFIPDVPALSRYVCPKGCDF